MSFKTYALFLIDVIPNLSFHLILMFVWVSYSRSELGTWSWSVWVSSGGIVLQMKSCVSTKIQSGDSEILCKRCLRGSIFLQSINKCGYLFLIKHWFPADMTFPIWYKRTCFLNLFHSLRRSSSIYWVIPIRSIFAIAWGDLPALRRL